MDKTINRCIIIIIAKKPYYDWASALPDGNPVSKLDECSSYLIDEGLDYTQAESFVKFNFDEFFTESLHAMWTDEAEWPQNRTWEMFNRWFDWHFSSMVWDLFDDKKIKYTEW